MSTQSSPGKSYTSPRNEDLPSSECWRLMASDPIGRVGLVLNGDVQIIPVNFETHKRLV